jgi:hypothetical protein
LKQKGFLGAAQPLAARFRAPARSSPTPSENDKTRWLGAGFACCGVGRGEQKYKMVDARSVPGAAAQEANFDISPEVRKVLDGANVMMRSLKGEKTQEARSPWCAAPPGQS